MSLIQTTETWCLDTNESLQLAAKVGQTIVFDAPKEYSLWITLLGQQRDIWLPVGMRYTVPHNTQLTISLAKTPVTDFTKTFECDLAASQKNTAIATMRVINESSSLNAMREVSPRHIIAWLTHKLYTQFSKTFRPSQSGHAV